MLLTTCQQVQQSANVGADADAVVMEPRIVSGSFLRVFDGRSFYRTKSLLQQGMCGGAVLLDDALTASSSSSSSSSSSLSSSSTLHCVGLVEATVARAAGRDASALVDAATVIDADKIVEFLDIEER